MKTSVAVVTMIAMMVIAGCARHGSGGGGGGDVAEVRRENAELKTRVAALESEVADLKLQRTPLTVNGLTIGTLTPPPPELKLTSNLIRSGTDGVSLGQGRITYIAAGTSSGDAALTITGTGTIEKGLRATTTTTKSATSTSTSTSTRTATPAK